jgi:hypothetical protein
MTFHNFLQGHWSAPICRSLQIWLFLQETLPCPIDGMIPLNIAVLVFSINRKNNVLVGGLKHEWILCSISLIWDVILNPLTKSIIFHFFSKMVIAPQTRICIRFCIQKCNRTTGLHQTWGCAGTALELASWSVKYGLKRWDFCPKRLVCRVWTIMNFPGPSREKCRVKSLLYRLRQPYHNLLKIPNALQMLNNEYRC